MLGLSFLQTILLVKKTCRIQLQTPSYQRTGVTTDKTHLCIIYGLLLKSGPGPWTRIPDPGPRPWTRTLDPDPGPVPRKT